jgi:transposase InsO family protein
MKVSRSCYYQWLVSPKTKREEENEQLIEMLKDLFKKGRGTYGTRRLKNKLADQGITVSRRRIGRLMVKAGLWCKTKKKFKVTTDSKHNKPIAPNLLKRHKPYQKLIAIMLATLPTSILKKAGCI